MCVLLSDGNECNQNCTTDKSVSASFYLQPTKDEISHRRSMEFQIISFLTHLKSGPHVTFIRKFTYESRQQNITLLPEDHVQDEPFFLVVKFPKSYCYNFHKFTIS